MATYTVIYREDSWLPHRSTFTQYIHQPLDSRRSLLATLICSRHSPQPTVVDAGIYSVSEHPDGSFWSLVEPLAPNTIELRSVDNLLLEQHVVG